MLEARFIKDNAQWERYVSSQKFTLFLQSAAYTQFLQKMGEEPRIVGLFEHDKLIGGSLISGVRAKRGHFLVLPYGPILDYSEPEQIHVFFDFVQKFAKEEKYDFIRISPFEKHDSQFLETLTSYGFVKAPIHILAEHTWMLNIEKDEDSLLAEMNKNHRNLIRRCIRDGVAVEKTTDEGALGRLNDMTDTVAKRHNFHRFSRSFIQGEMETFAQRGESLIFEARLPDGRVDASAMFIFYGTMAAYRHSASLHLDKKHPSSYLIQWEAIKEAKKRGITWYNFWGIAPESATRKHPFYGITHFKKGFGGEERKLIACHDLPLRKKYYLTRWFETARSIKRGFK